VNVTISYPINKSEDFIGLYTTSGEYYELEDNLYSDIVNWSETVNDTSTLLDNTDDYIIRTFRVNITKNYMNKIYYELSTTEEEYNKMGMWIMLNPGGGALGYSSMFTDSNNITWYIADITTGSGNWTVPLDVCRIDVLAVGGGAGAGKGGVQTGRNPGAGGAGGLIWVQNATQIGDVTITYGNNITYSIGSGGTGATVTTSPGGSGGDTTFGNLTAKGGGGGGSIESLNGVAGGSGGGGGRYNNNVGTGGTSTQSAQAGWSGLYGYGNSGAAGVSGDGGGGGGGAGSAGNGNTAGEGLDMSSYFGTAFGVNGVFAIGGTGSSDGNPGEINTGNGGNASSDLSGANGANGGSGIILIRWHYLTQVDPITPYNVSTSPLNVTATNFSAVDNVTLWYRWSNDNNSWGAWVIWNNDSNPDVSYPFAWSFNFPNSTGYYEFYSIGAIDDCYETKNNSEALCYYSMTQLDISVYPNSIDFGNINVGEYARTTEYYFNLSNNGTMCDIAITINNTQNWTFVNFTDLGLDMFSVNWSDDNWTSENNTKVGGSYLTTNLDMDDWYLFDIKVIMPKWISYMSNGEEFIITFTATPT
jgi:hypothetical protein